MKNESTEFDTYRAYTRTPHDHWDPTNVIDVPMLDMESDTLEEDLWLDQWAGDLSRRVAEDSSPIYCE